jgi:hypothetical protein
MGGFEDLNNKGFKREGREGGEGKNLKTKNVRNKDSTLRGKELGICGF